MRPAMTRYPYIFFDLDGTLTDPGAGITNSVAYALERWGIRVDDRRSLYPFIGPFPRRRPGRRGRLPGGVRRTGHL